MMLMRLGTTPEGFAANIPVFMCHAQLMALSQQELCPLEIPVK
jgi:hypothetical protein